jgi:hypothetical protein
MPIRGIGRRYPSPYIFNSEGAIYKALGENISEAIDDLPSIGGAVYLPPERLYIEDVINITKRVHLLGSGATKYGQAGGTCLESKSNLSGENMIQYDYTSLIEFGSIKDMTLYNQHGNDSIFIKSLVDVQIERVFFKYAVVDCIRIDGNNFNIGDVWIKDCWIENAGASGIAIDCADHEITEIHILNNSFAWCDIGVKFQRGATSGGAVRWAWICDNEMENIDKVGILLWKVCDHIKVDGNVLIKCGVETTNTYHAIRVGDGDVSADKCSWISILNNIIDGKSETKYGISLEDYADRILVMGNVVHGCATAPYNAEVNVTNVVHEHNIEV